MKKMFGVLLIGALLMGTSCTKYEEGSNFSFISAKARLVNHWTMTSYQVNNTTQSIQNNYGIDMDFYKDNTFKRTWKLGAFSTTESGTWTFANKKLDVLLTKKDGSTEVYRLIELKNKDMKAKTTDASGNVTQYTFKGN